MEWGQRAVADGRDLEARTQVQWASIIALNGWVNAGVEMVPPVHLIEHALSAHHDMAHGAGLVVVNPAYMRFIARARPERLAQFVRRIFGLAPEGKDELRLAMEGIDRFEVFLRTIGCPTRLSALGIKDDLLVRYAQDAVLVIRGEDGNLPGRPPLSNEDIIEVLRSAP